MRYYVALLPWVLLVAACGGSSSSSGSGGTSSGGTSSGGTSSGGSAGSTSSCSAKPPVDGSPCTSKAPTGAFGTAADCSWGDDPRPHCRTTAVCQNDTWSVKEPDASCQVDPKPAACPAAPASAGTACDDSTLRCWYDDGSVCSCSACMGGAEYPICRPIDTPEWACVKPADGCPNPPPQAGTPCSDTSLSCGTSCELPIRCENGFWQYGAEACPICAAPDTPIATPGGERPIAELRVGDLVYSVDHEAIVAVPVARVGSTPVFQHSVLKLTLSNGAILRISPGHPTATGAALSTLAVGARIDANHTVLAIELEPYTEARTYDILPSSTTGSYFAAGVQLGSTL